MKLIELLDVIYDGCTVRVFSATSDLELAELYDGRNSIDERFNDCEISMLGCSPYGVLEISINI